MTPGVGERWGTVLMPFGKPGAATGPDGGGDCTFLTGFAWLFRRGQFFSFIHDKAFLDEHLTCSYYECRD